MADHSLDIYKTEYNITRDENILILPINTLRLVDAILQVEIEKALGNTSDIDPFDEIVVKCIYRVEKDLGKLNKTDSKTVYDYMHDNIVKFYDMAPRTYVYYVLYELSRQKFTSNIIALFDNKELHEDSRFIKTDYYDGTIDNLAEYVKSNNITSIVIDSMESLYSLASSGKFDLNYITAFVSNFAYNYDDGLLKHFTDIKKLYPEIEIAPIPLLPDKPHHIIERIKEKSKNRKDKN